MMPHSLFVRLMGAFALVILSVVAVIAVIANQTTTLEFQQYMFRGQMVRLADIAGELAGYYRTRGSWEGVGEVLRGASNPVMSGMMGGGGPNMMGGGPGMMGGLWLAEPGGKVVASADDSRLGESLTPAERAAGTPVQLDGRTIGILSTNADMMHAVPDAAAQDFLAQVNRSVLLGALAAGLLALALGFVIVRQVTAPLDALAAASDRIAAGDLTARAPLRGGDEIARVARSFNAMADNLAHSEAARRNMLADVAHELRNPIGVLQSHLEAMLDGVFPADPAEFASLHEETIMLSRLVGDLRELALADAGQLTLQREPTDLRLLVERTVALFQPQANEQHVALTTELPPHLPEVTLDEQRIVQVLRNLLSNALRYTPAGGAVIVTLARQEQVAKVSVRDTGSGIAPEALSHVFERFWRGDKGRARSQGGAGLGLAIARQWVRAHGGEIGVESQLGQGTVFWFTVPI